MNEDFDKYLGIANHDIQMANNMGELKSYVANILYDNDKKVELLQQRDSIIKEVREKVNNFDVFKEFTFPLMKRDVENQVKSSIDYEWRKSIKEPILEILDKVDKDV